jgi:hypothetical protein
MSYSSVSKQTKYCFIAIAMLISFYSCRTYTCSEANGLRISTISLTKNDRDTIILRKFTKASAFTKLVDTLLIDSTKVVYEMSNDTANIVANTGDVLLKSKYDYEIYIPGISKLVKITEINEPQQEIKRGFSKVGCVNTIQSYQQDGQTLTLNQYDYDKVYIHK